jgi:hypothetical protein
MTQASLFSMIQKSDAGNIVLAYKGEINAELLETVYSMMEKHMDEKKVAPDKRKKFFLVLIEALQNIFHHQANHPTGSGKTNSEMTGFVIRKEGDDSYNIVTGNYLHNADVEKLKNKINEVNELTPEALRNYHMESLAGSEFSEKGGAGLGIIEMARRSGSKLKYEFKKIDNIFSFFSLSITIP